MKAKDYYKIIQDAPHTRAGLEQAVGEVVDKLNAEAKDIIKARRAIRGKAVYAVIREQNDKWNAIVALHEKEFSATPLLRNSFINAWLKVMPELCKYQ